MTEPEITTELNTKFYQDCHGKLKLLFALILVVLLTLSALIFLQFTNKPETVYFRENSNGQLLQEQSLSQAAISDSTLTNWILDNVVNSNSYNYTSLPRVFDKVRPQFSKQGFEDYKKSLGYRDYLSEILVEKMIVSASPRIAPTVEKEGVENGIYSWIIKIPMVFKYSNYDVDRSKNYDITVLVRRVSTDINPIGVIIHRYFSEDKSPQVRKLSGTR